MTEIKKCTLPKDTEQDAKNNHDYYIKLLERMQPDTHIHNVLEYLLTHGSITSMDAIMNFGCTRLTAYIFILKNTFHIPIETTLETNYKNGSRMKGYARYRIGEKL